MTDSRKLADEIMAFGFPWGSDAVRHDVAVLGRRLAQATLQDILHAEQNGTHVYDMLGAYAVADAGTTEMLIHMVAATVLSKLIDDEGGGRSNITFSPADMDAMNKRYEMVVSREGMETTIKLAPRPGAFAANGEALVPTIPGDPVIALPPEPLYRDSSWFDQRDVKPQAAEHVYDRPLWAARINGVLVPASSNTQASNAVREAIAKDAEAVAAVENRFCYHDDCPAERCNHVPEEDGPEKLDVEVTSGD